MIQPKPISHLPPKPRCQHHHFPDAQSPSSSQLVHHVQRVFRSVSREFAMALQLFPFTLSSHADYNHFLYLLRQFCDSPPPPKKYLLIQKQQQQTFKSHRILALIEILKIFLLNFLVLERLTRGPEGLHL